MRTIFKAFIFVLAIFIVVSFLPPDNQIVQMINENAPYLRTVSNSFHERLINCWNCILEVPKAGIYPLRNCFVMLYLFLINIIEFLTMGIDKWRAEHYRVKERISNNTLMTLAIIGGSLGGWIGMYFHHHKTKKPGYVYGIPIIVLLHIVIIVYIWGGVF